MPLIGRIARRMTEKTRVKHKERMQRWDGLEDENPEPRGMVRGWMRKKIDALKARRRRTAQDYGDGEDDDEPERERFQESGAPYIWRNAGPATRIQMVTSLGHPWKTESFRYVGQEWEGLPVNIRKALVTKYAGKRWLPDDAGDEIPEIQFDALYQRSDAEEIPWSPDAVRHWVGRCSRSGHPIFKSTMMGADYPGGVVYGICYGAGDRVQSVKFMGVPENVRQAIKGKGRKTLTWTAIERTLTGGELHQKTEVELVTMRWQPGIIGDWISTHANDDLSNVRVRKSEPGAVFLERRDPSSGLPEGSMLLLTKVPKDAVETFRRAWDESRHNKAAFLEIMRAEEPSLMFPKTMTGGELHQESPHPDVTPHPPGGSYKGVTFYDFRGETERSVIADWVNGFPATVGMGAVHLHRDLRDDQSLRLAVDDANALIDQEIAAWEYAGAHPYDGEYDTRLKVVHRPAFAIVERDAIILYAWEGRDREPHFRRYLAPTVAPFPPPPGVSPMFDRWVANNAIALSIGEEEVRHSDPARNYARQLGILHDD